MSIDPRTRPQDGSTLDLSQPHATARTPPCFGVASHIPYLPVPHTFCSPACYGARVRRPSPSYRRGGGRAPRAPTVIAGSAGRRASACTRPTLCSRPQGVRARGRWRAAAPARRRATAPPPRWVRVRVRVRVRARVRDRVRDRARVGVRVRGRVRARARVRVRTGVRPASAVTSLRRSARPHTNH